MHTSTRHRRTDMDSLPEFVELPSGYGVVPRSQLRHFRKAAYRQLLSMLGRGVQIQPKEITSSIESVELVFSNVDLLRNIVLHMVEDTGLNGLRSIMVLSWLASVCLGLSHVFCNSNQMRGILAALRLEVFSRMCVTQRSDLWDSPHVYRDAQAYTYTIRLLKQMNSEDQIAHLTDGVTLQALHCALQSSHQFRISFNSEKKLEVAHPRKRARVHEEPCSINMVSQSALLISSTNTQYHELLVVVSRRTRTACPSSCEDITKSKRKELEVALFSGSCISTTLSGEGVCRLLATSEIPSGASARADASALTASTPHHMCTSNDGNAIAVACTMERPDNISALWVISVRVDEETCGMSVPQLIAPPNTREMHAQTAWFMDDNNRNTLVTIYSSMCVSPDNTVFIESPDGRCSFVVTRHIRDHNNTWQFLMVSDRFDHLLIMDCPCAGGTMAALLVENEEVEREQLIRFWNADDDAPTISIDIHVDLDDECQVGMTTQSIAMSPSGETFVHVLGFGIEHPQFNDTYAQVQIYKRAFIDGECTYTYASRVEEPRVTCLMDERHKITYDAHFSPCERFVVMLSGRHRFGYTEMTIATIDLWNTLAIGNHPPIARIVHEQHSEMDAYTSRTACLRYIEWTFNGMFLALGRGAVYLRQHTRLGELKQALVSHGA